MFGRERDTEIDAGAALDQAESRRISGERGAAGLGSGARSRVPGMRMFVLMVLAAVAALMIAFAWKAWSLRSVGEGDSRTEVVRQVIPALADRPVQREATPPRPAEPMLAAATGPLPIATRDRPPELSLEEKIRARMLKSRLKSGGAVAALAAPPETGAAGIGRKGAEPGDLEQKLEPLKLKGAAAGTIPDRDMFITQGTMIDCALETRMVTTQPGMAVCRLTRDVYSASGRVILLDRGSKVVGFYQGGLKQGQARIFVQWSRVETPEGVVIALASPGTGPLGEAGVGGEIDTHFWERFGGAILISIIGDLGKAASSFAGKSDNGGTTITFDNTSQGVESAVTEALKSSIDIPPTLSKDQGERVAILVARDLDFRGVYDLRPN